MVGRDLNYLICNYFRSNCISIKLISNIKFDRAILTKYVIVCVITKLYIHLNNFNEKNKIF